MGYFETSKDNQRAIKAANQTISTVGLTPCTDLSFTLKSSTSYLYSFVLYYAPAATTTGLKLGVSFSGSISNIKYGADIPLTVSTANRAASTTSGGAITVTDSTLATNIANLDGSITTTTVGTLQLQIASDVVASMTVSSGSYGTLFEV